MNVSLQRQAERVELQLMGEKARLEAVKRDQKWPLADIEQKRVAIAELEAALATMKQLARGQI